MGSVNGIVIGWYSPQPSSPSNSVRTRRSIAVGAMRDALIRRPVSDVSDGRVAMSFGSGMSGSGFASKSNFTVTSAGVASISPDTSPHPPASTSETNNRRSIMQTPPGAGLYRKTRGVSCANRAPTRLARNRYASARRETTLDGMARTALLVLAVLAAGCRGKGTSPDKAPKSTAPAKAYDGMSIVPKDGLLATVREVELSRREFDELFAIKQKLGLPPKAAMRHRQKLVRRLVYEEILRQEAAALGVSVAPTRVQEAIAQQKQGVADWSVHLRRRGETDASLKSRLTGELLEVAILEHHGKLTVSDADVAAEFEEIKGLPRATEELARQRVYEKRLAQARNELRPALRAKYAPVLHLAADTVGK